MKDIFHDFYQQHKDLKARFEAAKEKGDKAAIEQVRADHQILEDSIEAKGVNFATIYSLYEKAMDAGNEHIDICEIYQYRNEAALIACFREYGIKAFTFSSTWSSAVESAWKFTQHGCSLQGMVQINSNYTDYNDEPEKRSAFLFKVEEVR